MVLTDCYITAAARCAPPDNRPTRDELARCRRYLRAEIDALPSVGVVLTLGRIGWESWLAATDWWTRLEPRTRPKFRHGEESMLSDGTILVASYHPSRQNTNTGRLTRPMWYDVFRRIRNLLDEARPRPV